MSRDFALVLGLADLANLEDEEVLGRERVAELVRVDLEQDRGHSTFHSLTFMGLHQSSVEFWDELMNYVIVVLVS